MIYRLTSWNYFYEKIPFFNKFSDFKFWNSVLGFFTTSFVFIVFLLFHIATVVMNPTFKFVLPQSFSLNSTIMKYLIEKVKPKILKKLYKTCKYFYAKLHLNIIGQFSLSPFYKKVFIMESKYQTEIHAPNNYLEDKNAKMIPENLWITSAATFETILSFSLVTSKINRCEITELVIKKCNVTVDEFKILNMKDTIDHFDMYYSKIYYSKDSEFYLAMDEILNLVPNASTIGFTECHVTENSMKNLLLNDRKVKFEHVTLAKIDGILDPFEVNEFFKRNVGPDTFLVINLKDLSMNKIFFDELHSLIYESFPDDILPRAVCNYNGRASAAMMAKYGAYIRHCSAPNDFAKWFLDPKTGDLIVPKK